jgi:hypothetical protein
VKFRHVPVGCRKESRKSLCSDMVPEHQYKAPYPPHSPDQGQQVSALFLCRGPRPACFLPSSLPVCKCLAQPFPCTWEKMSQHNCSCPVSGESRCCSSQQAVIGKAGLQVPLEIEDAAFSPELWRRRELDHRHYSWEAGTHLFWPLLSFWPSSLVAAGSSMVVVAGHNLGRSPLLRADLVRLY